MANDRPTGPQQEHSIVTIETSVRRPIVNYSSETHYSSARVKYGPLDKYLEFFEFQYETMIDLREVELLKFII